MRVGEGEFRAQLAQQRRGAFGGSHRRRRFDDNQTSPFEHGGDRFERGFYGRDIGFVIVVIGVGTATTNASAVSGVVTARSMPDFTAAPSTISRSGSTICARPELIRSTASRLMSTPMTSKPRAANVAAVGSPT